MKFLNASRETVIFLVVLAAAAGVGSLSVTQPYGAGLSPDSVNYISSARNLAAGSGLQIYSGEPLVIHAPLFPFFLALPDWLFGLDPLEGVRWFQAFVLGLIVFLTGVLYLRLLRSRLLALLGTVFVLCSFPLIEVTLMAWTEPLFVVFGLLLLLDLQTYLEEPGYRRLTRLSLWAALAALTRFNGVMLVGVSLPLILLHPRLRLAERLRQAFVHGAIVLVPFALWLGRNYYFSRTLMGWRESSSHPLFQNLYYVYEVLRAWYLPKVVYSSRMIVAALMILVAFLVLYQLRELWLKDRKTLRSLAPPGVFLAVYLISLVITTTVIDFTRIDNRYMVPALTPLTGVLLVVLERTFKFGQKRYPPFIENVLLMAGIMIWLAALVSPTADLVRRHFQSGGPGFNNQAWRTSPTILYLKAHQDLDCPIYSNAPDAVYLYTLQPARRTPVKRGDTPRQIKVRLEQLKGNFPREDQACLVWIDIIQRSYLLEVEKLKKIIRIDDQVILKDGVVYWISRQ